MRNRIENLRSVFYEQCVDAMIVMKPENRRYLSGFSGSAGILFITASDAYLLTDFRYVEQAEQEAQGYTIIKHGDKIIDSLKEVVKVSHCQAIGFEKDFVTYANYELLNDNLSKCKLVPTDNVTERLRAVKDQDEINRIAAAVSIADSAFDHMCSVLVPGMTEKAAAVELEYFMRQKGSQKNSFPPIIASGPRASLPHAQPTERKIQVGDMVKMDFGGTYDGYCSDLTRTVFMGKTTQQQEEIYQIVLKAQILAIESVIAGMRGAAVDSVARDFITENGYGEYFGHGLGHGVGLFIHEAPRLSQTSSDILQQGNVVTVEPGIYIPDWGGVRIEDMLVVQPDGYQNLTHANKEMVIL